MTSVILKNVTKRFNSYTAVNNLNMEIKEGSFFTFLGPSGCGKTTTLRMISGFTTPSEGTIYIGNEDVTHLEPEKRKVGMVFQNYALFPHMNVFDNVAYGLKMMKLRKTEIKDRVKKYLKMVELDGYENRKISELSGGQQQRIALARSLVIEPSILLLDEPLSNLDAKLRETMRFELKRIQKELKITTIYVTHDQTEALTMSDEIAVFNKGICQQISSPKGIYENPVNSFVAKFIGEANLFRVNQRGNEMLIENQLPVVIENEGKGSFLLVRPTSITLSYTATNGVNEWQAIVKSKQYYGSHSSYIMNVRGLEFQVDVAPLQDGHYEIGEEVFLSVDPKELSLIPDGQEEKV
ncbi:ABC transporter ATP-binding protein [Niallia sp. Krafla_26]|uniref:ABC transporter ATP-binding protein n=1 Tax=Niallia sp. Krafla_26 TaxID=3064703 RepID=UPI003D17BB99